MPESERAKERASAAIRPAMCYRIHHPPNIGFLRVFLKANDSANSAHTATSRAVRTAQHRIV